MTCSDPASDGLSADREELTKLIEAVLPTASAHRPFVPLHEAVDGLLRGVELLDRSVVALVHDEIDGFGVPLYPFPSAGALDTELLEVSPAGMITEAGQGRQLLM